MDLIFANVNPEDILLKEDLDELVKADKAWLGFGGVQGHIYGRDLCAQS